MGLFSAGLGLNIMVSLGFAGFCLFGLHYLRFNLGLFCCVGAVYCLRSAELWLVGACLIVF